MKVSKKQLPEAAIKSISTLIEIVNDKKASPLARSNAARTLLQEAGRVRLEAQIDAELEVLRQEIKNLAAKHARCERPRR